jgi:hypothetical protein
MLLLAAPSAAVADGYAALLSYEGRFSGSGTAVYENGATDRVDCRLGLEAGARGRMYLRDTACTVAGTRITLQGVMAFVPDGRYEAAVTSNAGFSGGAVGTGDASGIRFTIDDGRIGDGSLALSATFVLAGDAVGVEMAITSNVSGAVTRVTVPMGRER